MIKDNLVEYFERSWIDAWNNHDLDKIMEPFADEVEFISPNIFFRSAITDGKLIGKEALRAHYKQSLELSEDLEARSVEVLLGVDSIVVIYRRENRGELASFMIFDANEKIISMREHYSPYIIADLPEED
jgi:hypothetical protein